MGLESRNNSYEENQNEVLSFLHRGPMLERLGGRSSMRLQGLGEAMAGVGRKAIWEAFGRLSGPPRHDQGKSYWLQREKAPLRLGEGRPLK